MTTENKKEQQQDEFGVHGAPVKATAVGVLVFAILSLLLNGPWVRKDISDSSYREEGDLADWREIKLKLIEPVAVISEKTHFDAPRKFVEEEAGEWLNGGAGSLTPFKHICF